VILAGRAAVGAVAVQAGIWFSKSWSGTEPLSGYLIIE
jgi:hypothetical protein